MEVMPVHEVSVWCTPKKLFYWLFYILNRCLFSNVMLSNLAFRKADRDICRIYTEAKLARQEHLADDGSGNCLRVILLIQHSPED